MYKNKRRQTTKGWDPLAKWYDGWMGQRGSYHHQQLAIPAVLDLLELRSVDRVLDMGCGQGVLAQYVSKTGAAYTGIDASPKLIDIAKQRNPRTDKFVVADVTDKALASQLGGKKFSAAVFLLSIQDIADLKMAIANTAALVNKHGRVVLLLMHPAFRIPRQSGWGFDEGRKLQYRRVDRYLSPMQVPLKAYPGSNSGVSISHHRPMSDYINTLADNGFVTDRLLEIPASALNKSRNKAEEMATAEIPLFLAIRAIKIND